MRRFVEGTDRGQSTLFPECLEDWICEDNPVRAIDVFVDELELAELGFGGVDPETLEAESLALELLRRALSGCSSRAAAGSIGRRKLVDRAKLVLASDLGRRWTLAAIAADVGVSPVYLTQVFQQVEGLPLYRYQLQLRLARALDLLGDNAGLTSLALDLGFSSHSHFSAAFKRAYGQTPSAFQRSARIR